VCFAQVLDGSIILKDAACPSLVHLKPLDSKPFGSGLPLPKVLLRIPRESQESNVPLSETLVNAQYAF